MQSVTCSLLDTLLQVSPDHPVSNYASHYLPESRLQRVEPDQNDERISVLLHVGILPRYFGAILIKKDGIIHFNPSNELLARYPDDFDIQEAETDAETDGSDNQSSTATTDAEREGETRPIWQRFSEVLRVE